MSGSQLAADASYKTANQNKICNLLLENDVLVLFCWNENEMYNLCMDIAMTVCTEIGKGSVRHPRSLEEFTFEDLDAGKVHLLIFSDLATNLNLFGKKNCSQSFETLSRVCSKGKGVHALICIPKKKNNEFSLFLKTLKTSSLHHTCHKVPPKKRVFFS